jgi:tetratricopeptide (TPR) repeat protein
MSKEVKEKTQEEIDKAHAAIKALYFSGKVKPSLNKILVELANDPDNLDLTLLACQCLLRGKDFDQLATYADACIKMAPKNAEGHYYKGEALQHIKGKEQEALKNFNEALVIDPENIIYLKGKGSTHLSLYADFHLPIALAEKHRVKGEESFAKIIALVEEKEAPDFIDYLTMGDVSITLNRNLDAKKFYIRAVKAFDAADEADQDMNIYKDIIKAQKACIKKIETFTE